MIYNVHFKKDVLVLFKVKALHKAKLIIIIVVIFLNTNDIFSAFNVCVAFKVC